MRLIDADALEKTLEKLWNIHDDQDFCNKDVWREIENAQTVEPKERTAKVDAGHKSVITGKLMDGHCMQCGRYVMDEDDYCPGCGARLEWNE